jgi:hypothetical protein
MAFVIVIRRFARPDREPEFLEKYRANRSDNPDFLGETLTKLSNDASIPDAMRTLFTILPGSINYLNIAKWRTWQAFVGQCSMEPGYFDPDIENAPRERFVLEIIEETPGTEQNN